VLLGYIVGENRGKNGAGGNVCGPRSASFSRSVSTEQINKYPNMNE